MNVVLKAESISGKLENPKTVRGASAMSNSCGQVFTCLYMSHFSYLCKIERENGVSR